MILRMIQRWLACRVAHVSTSIAPLSTCSSWAPMKDRYISAAKHTIPNISNHMLYGDGGGDGDGDGDCDCDDFV